MGNIKKNIKSLLWISTLLFSNIFYGLLNNSNRGFNSLMLDIDRSTPFIKEFIIPYIIWYPFILIFLVYICLKDKTTYYKTLISLNIGLIICYIIFYFFQTTVLRPELIGSDVFIKLVKFIYAHDEPYNCFPSVHVITTYTVMKGVNFASKEKPILMLSNVIGILIILSTIFVKQHVILDVIASIVLGDTIFRCCFAAKIKKTAEQFS